MTARRPRRRRRRPRSGPVHRPAGRPGHRGGDRAGAGDPDLRGVLPRRDRRATAGTTLVATDARRKEIYWAVYEDGVRVDAIPRSTVRATSPRCWPNAASRRPSRSATARCGYAQDMTGSNCPWRMSRVPVARGAGRAGGGPRPRRSPGRGTDPALPAPAGRGRAGRPQAGEAMIGSSGCAGGTSRTAPDRGRSVRCGAVDRGDVLERARQRPPLHRRVRRTATSSGTPGWRSTRRTRRG